MSTYLNRLRGIVWNLASYRHAQECSWLTKLHELGGTIIVNGQTYPATQKGLEQAGHEHARKHLDYPDITTKEGSDRYLAAPWLFPPVFTPILESDMNAVWAKHLHTLSRDCDNLIKRLDAVAHMTRLTTPLPMEEKP